MKTFEITPAATPIATPPALGPAVFDLADSHREPDSYTATAFADLLDRALHASIARSTGGLSPAALASAYLDWAIHLGISPGKQMQLFDKALRNSWRLANQTIHAALTPEIEPCIKPLPQDRRFLDDAWRAWPYSFIYQAFLLNQQWWHIATTGVGGVTRQHENVVEFASRQVLDVVSPSNFLLTNPQLQLRTFQTGGANLLQGFYNFLQDAERFAAGTPPLGAEAFRPGVEVATSPGKVVYRNRLIELIQYAPATELAWPEPVLVTPAWIMKYYILDLSPQNSLVRHLTSQGFTVFMISWLNPGPEDRDLGMDDYRQLGVMSALDAITTAMPGRKVHAAGYCLGGTLLSVAAAAMARDKDDRLQSVSLFAAQTDFTEAGELTLFINEAQIHFLEDLMWEQGFLDASQMAATFQLLRSSDLIWSHALRSYLMGERDPMSDMMAWNADATRMPFKMHSEYLRRLCLNNDLAEGRLMVAGRAIAVADIRAPIFAVGAEKDHVAPWRSTYKIHLLADTEVTYLLASGGHNAGIVPEPGRKGVGYRVMTKSADDPYADPKEWLGLARRREGLWWSEWTAWLSAHSGAPVAAPRMIGALCDAPGTYVHQR